MKKLNNIRLVLPAIILLSLSSNVNAQINPEVTLGAKYLGEAQFLLFDREFPVAPELGAGVNFNNKWYAGISSYYYGEKGIYDEHEWKAKYTSLELEIRRSFPIKQFPKLVPYITAKPGIMLCNFSTEDERYTNTSVTLIATSISTGMSYIISDRLKFSLSPGVTRIVNKNRFFNFGDTGVSSFVLDLGITYEF